MYDPRSMAPEEYTPLFERIVASIEPLDRAFTERDDLPSTLVLDHQVGSLVPVNAWFGQAILDPHLGEEDGLPVWWDPAMPTLEEDPRMRYSRWQLRLISEVQAYFATMILRTWPEWRWEIAKIHKQQINQNEAVLRLPGTPNSSVVDIRAAVYAEGINALEGRATDPAKQVNRVLLMIEKINNGPRKPVKSRESFLS